MAELIPSVMFYDDDEKGYSNAQVTEFNFELMERLGSLEKGGSEYMKVAQAFHAEVAQRQRG